MKAALVLLIVAGLMVVVSAVVIFFNVRDNLMAERPMVGFDATVVYRNASTFTVQAGEFRDGEPVCVPDATDAIGWNRQHNEMQIWGYSIWSDAPETRLFLGDGVVRDGACVVEVQLTVPISPSQSVHVGCESWYLGAAQISPDDDWHAGTLEYWGCVPQLDSPAYWPVGLVDASQRLRQDAISALDAIGMASEHIEASRVAQPHPQKLDACGGILIRDTDAEAFRFEEGHLVELAEHWKAAGYHLITLDFNEGGPNEQVRVIARMDDVGMIQVSWRKIGPNGNPFILDLATPCFERDLTLSD